MEIDHIKVIIWGFEENICLTVFSDKYAHLSIDAESLQSPVTPLYFLYLAPVRLNCLKAWSAPYCKIQ